MTSAVEEQRIDHPSGCAENTALKYNISQPIIDTATATPTAIKHSNKLDGRDSGL
jgi:hypothetical protein